MRMRLFLLAQDSTTPATTAVTQRSAQLHQNLTRWQFFCRRIPESSASPCHAATLLMEMQSQSLLFYLQSPDGEVAQGGIGLELTGEGIISGGGGIPAPGKKVAISMLTAPLIRFLEGKWRGYRGKVGGTMARTIVPHDSWRNNGNVAVLNSARSRTSGHP
uniref:Uncharacterized protein n=1 Tax=Oryza glumipatula TaxID=40148 RepID=A0A0E0AUY2_9ORYZ